MQHERDRIFDLSNDILCTSDFDGRLCVTNPQAERTLGYPADELCGLDVADLIHPADLTHAREVLGRLRRGEETHGVEMRVRRHDGTWCWLSSSSVPCRKSGRIYTVAHDITEQKAERGGAARLRESAAHLSRQIWLGQLASEIIHELRQPLTIVVNNVSAAARYLERGPEFTEAANNAIRRAVDEALRASDTLERLREPVRGKPLDMGSVDVNDVVRDALAIVEARATGDEPPIELVLGDPLRTVHGDATLLAQVVVNLLDNASEAAAAAGGEPRAPRPTVVLRTAEGEEGGVQIRVSDSGPGIAPEVIESLFDPFVSTRTDRPGLGLAICKRVVEAHRGGIRAETAPGGGAVFTVVLPALGGAGTE